MKMIYTNNRHLDTHTITFEVNDQEMMTAGIHKLGVKPSKLEMIRMLQRVAENDLEKFKEGE